ncbi:hypothetical protein Dimus_008713, partial [Dionaea muscipula]
TEDLFRNLCSGLGPFSTWTEPTRRRKDRDSSSAQKLGRRYELLASSMSLTTDSTARKEMLPARGAAGRTCSRWSWSYEGRLPAPQGEPPLLAHEVTGRRRPATCPGFAGHEEPLLARACWPLTPHCSPRSGDVIAHMGF